MWRGLSVLYILHCIAAQAYFGCLLNTYMHAAGFTAVKDLTETYVTTHLLSKYYVINAVMDCYVLFLSRPSVQTIRTPIFVQHHIL